MDISVNPLDSAQTRTNELKSAGAWSLAYALVSFCTGAYFMADTVDYVAAVQSYDHGNHGSLWEFGHLFWRPFGWILLHAIEPLTRLVTGIDPTIELTYVFLTVNWVAGLACVLLLRGLLRRFSISPAIANLATLGMLFSNAFLNYIHSGSSYIPGLAFLLLGLYLLAADAQTLRSPLRPIWVAGALAFSVCLWFPYVFAVPGALATPLFRRSDNQSRWALTLRATLYCLVLGIAFYGFALASLRIFTADGIYRWITAESNAIGGVRGVTRTIFGFARSFVYMGDDGVLFKRFLLHDRYNPVTVLELIRASLFKLFLFYALLLAMLKQLLQSANRDFLWLFALTTMPVIFFALMWFGGDMERYLPLYPIVFLCASYSVDRARAPRYLKRLALLFLLVTIASNLGATSILTIRKKQAHAEVRLKDLLPVLKPQSRIVLSDIQDELENFTRTYPLDSMIRTHLVRTYPVLNPATAQTLHWRTDLCRVVVTTWNSGADVWISKRISATQPQADWKWVEGQDPRVSWADLRSVFAQFDYGTSVGDSDGFILLLPTQRNKNLLDSLRTEDGLKPPMR
jgi:hypothetical protein